MKELTKAEEQVMQILWKLKKAFVKEILAEMPEPQPAYTTVSTIIRILENKEFVSHESFGKTHRYYPLVSQDAYREFIAGGLIKDYFGGSMANLVSHFSKKEQLSAGELDEILRIIENQKRTK